MRQKREVAQPCLAALASWWARWGLEQLSSWAVLSGLPPGFHEP